MASKRSAKRPFNPACPCSSSAIKFSPSRCNARLTDRNSDAVTTTALLCNRAWVASSVRAIPHKATPPIDMAIKDSTATGAKSLVDIFTSLSLRSMSH